MLCTARPFDSLARFGALDLGVDWDGYIASAGGVTFADGIFLHKTLMKRDDVTRFIALATKEKRTMELVGTTTRSLISPPDDFAMAFYNHYNEHIPEVASYDGQDVIGFNFFAPESYDAEFMKAFPQLIYSRYFESAVDVMGEPHLKGLSVDRVLRHYGYSKGEAMGFGDDLQDISMAQHVGTFVCMGQGKDEVKKQASYITTPVWDDGVERALQHFGLVEEKKR